MRSQVKILIILIAGIGLSSCGAIPTLPPLDSTVTIRTPQITVGLVLPTASSEVIQATAIPSSITPIIKPSATRLPVITASNTTAASSATQKASVTPKPSSTPYLTATSKASFTLTATFTKTATFTPTAVPYSLQLMNPYYLPNFTHPDLGCKWLGVAGQVFSKDGQVQKDILIKAGGTINGSKLIENMTMPLAEPAVDLAYGPGGYEMTLAASLQATTSVVWIQLFNLKGDPISEKIYLVTYNDCQKNLILMNFIEK